MLPKTRTTGHKSNKNNGNGNKKKHSTLATHTTCQKTERESEKRGNCLNWGENSEKYAIFFSSWSFNFSWLVADLAGPT